MHAPAPSTGAETRRHRPRMTTVFGASFLAGAVLAFGVNRVLDVHVRQAQPQVECEPIFVALRSMPQGSPVTIWDVALRDWPKAMLPTTALKAHDSFTGTVLKYPLREGQPLLSVQLVRDTSMPTPTVVAEAAAPAVAQPAPDQVAAVDPTVDAWTPVPAEPSVPVAAPATPAGAPAQEPAPATAVDPAPGQAGAAEQAAIPTTPDPAVPTEGFDEAEVTDLPATTVAPEAVSVTQSAPATETPAATEPAPAGEPTLADAPAGEPTLADAGSLPFAAPVPALPPTDIGGALAEVSAPRSRLAAAPAASTESVLTSATTALAASGPKRYLVVPERIALQADASFVDQPPTPPQPDPQPAAKAPTQDTSRTATAGGRSTNAPARSPATAVSPKRSPSPAREAVPSEKKPVPRGGGWFSGAPQAWGGIGAALRRPQADQSSSGLR